MIFELTQGDTEPPLRAILKDADGRVAVLQPTDVVHLRMKPAIPGLRASIDNAAEVIDADEGDVQYQWVPADTATPGVFEAEFHVSNPTGYSKTFPNDEYIQVVIKPKAY